MAHLRKKLPPPNSLVAFEAAARFQNFTHAARELGVTQAAVSRQMRTLEDFLGVPLFIKAGRMVRLSKSGKILQQGISTGFDRIVEAIDQIQGEQQTPMIAVTTTPAVALLWLPPRLQQFRKDNAGIDISVIATDWLLDLPTENIDLAIRYGAGQWPGGTSTFLFDEEIFPICSPDYLSDNPISEPLNLIDADLIHFETSLMNKAVWRDWFEIAGVALTPSKAGMRYDNYQAILNATIEGEGVALGCSHLVDKYLEQGRLVKPLDHSFKSPNAFWIYTPDNIPLSDATSSFYHHIQDSVGPARTS